MNSITRYIRDHCSCCLNCGSFFPKEGLLCLACLKALGRLEQRTWRETPPLTVRSLYYWYPGQSDLLSSLILALKGKGKGRAWQYYADEFAKKMAPMLPTDKRLCVIPAPSSQKTPQDHAFLWGRALAQSLGAGFLPCLKKVSTGSQRGAGRGERALLEMEVSVNSSEGVGFTSNTHWIFADDILTTGATARAAYLALGSPPHFEVWVLAQRGLSCGASKDLL